MIETTKQRDKRIKAETAERGLRAIRHAEWMAKQNPSVAETEEQKARKLTARIKAGFEDTLNLLQQAHDEKSWAALGYKSFQEYCVGELNISKSRGYQLLNHFGTTKALKDSTNVESPVCEAQTRALSGLKPAQKKKAWEAAVKLAGGQPTAEQIKQSIPSVISVEPDLTQNGRDVDPVIEDDEPPAEEVCPTCNRPLP